jgi:hypothetical protein
MAKSAKAIPKRTKAPVPDRRMANGGEKVVKADDFFGDDDVEDDKKPAAKRLGTKPKAGHREVVADDFEAEFDDFEEEQVCCFFISYYFICFITFYKTLYNNL